MSNILASIRNAPLSINLLSQSSSKSHLPEAKPLRLPYFAEYASTNTLTVILGPPLAGKSVLLSQLCSLFTGLVVVFDLDSRLEVTDENAKLLILRPSNADEFLACLRSIKSTDLFQKCKSATGGFKLCSDGSTKYKFSKHAALTHPLAAVLVDGLSAFYWESLVLNTWSGITSQTVDLLRDISLQHGNISTTVTLTALSPFPSDTSLTLILESVWPMIQGAGAYVLMTRVPVAERLHDNATDDDSDPDWLSTSLFKMTLHFPSVSVTKRLSMSTNETDGVTLLDDINEINANFNV
ncbi:hypothetical protein V1512DRAFT_249947 [Lipomyces arxii]|uniref:uncharacterized protein n=1 Tax=Lipomyces arxii TaxID=56418 RepID=UPI0034D0153A